MGWQVAAAAGPPPADCFMTELSGLLEGPEVRTSHRCCALLFQSLKQFPPALRALAKQAVPDCSQEARPCVYPILLCFAPVKCGA